MNETEAKNNLKAIRKKLSLTQEEMGAELGLNRNAYRALESGPTHVISQHVYKMAELANVTVEHVLLGYDPQPVPEAALRETAQLQDLLKTERENYENQLARKDEIIASKDALILAKDRTIKVQEDMIAMLNQK